MGQQQDSGRNIRSPHSARAEPDPRTVRVDEVPTLEGLPERRSAGSGTLIASTPATKSPVPAFRPADPHPSPEGDEPGWPSASPLPPQAGGAEDTDETPAEDAEELDELTVVARAQDGDLQAFDWLITAYQGGIFRLCLRMLNDRSDAEDIVQETFIAAWRSLPKLSAPQSFVPWLYRTATNKCLDVIRRRQRRPTDPTGDPESDVQQESPRHPRGGSVGGAGTPADPAQLYENQAQMRALADLVQTLPPGPRACWLLREVHEFSYGEIAAIVQVPESTVRGRIARAKRLLAEGMEPWR